MKTYLVTGAGSGIGKAISGALASASTDNQIVLIGRQESKLLETRASLPDPERHLTVVADVRDAARLRSEFERIGLDRRDLHGVVANAGLGGENRYGASDRWDEIIDTNLKGTYLLVNEALPALRRSSSEFRHIVVISSILARIGVPAYSAYCASKAGLLGLVRSWAAELAAERVLVNAICPGWVATDMAQSGIRAMAEGSGRSQEEVLGQQMSHVPLRKMSEPEELGRMVAFLMSGQQTSITGQALDVNNGAWMG